MMKNRTVVIIASSFSLLAAGVVGYLIGQEVAWRRAVQLQGLLLRSSVAGAATFNSLIASELVENNNEESRARMMALLQIQLEGYARERNLLESYPYRQDFSEFRELDETIEYLLPRLHERIEAVNRKNTNDP